MIKHLCLAIVLAAIIGFVVFGLLILLEAYFLPVVIFGGLLVAVVWRVWQDAELICAESERLCDKQISE